MDWRIFLYSTGTCCPYVLKQAAVPIVDTALCNGTTMLTGEITENMFCAGQGGNDACHVCFIRK